jgi:hypothetical protein
MSEEKRSHVHSSAKDKRNGKKRHNASREKSGDHDKNSDEISEKRRESREEMTKKDKESRHNSSPRLLPKSTNSKESSASLSTMGSIASSVIPKPLDPPATAPINTGQSAVSPYVHNTHNLFHLNNYYPPQYTVQIDVAAKDAGTDSSEKDSNKIAEPPTDIESESCNDQQYSKIKEENERKKNRTNTNSLHRPQVLRDSHRRSMSDNMENSKDERVKLNVGGKIFETYASTLRKHPNTLLGAMFHPRNAQLLKNSKDENGHIFFDRNPRVFEVILDFYRTGKLIRTPDIPLELLKEELDFFQMNIEEDSAHKRLSMELMKLEYRNKIMDAEEYRKITRSKLLSQHHDTLVNVLEFMHRKIEKEAKNGHNSCVLTFLSPLHYTDSTPREVFNVVSLTEVRDLIIELLQEKHFEVTQTYEYSKTKATNIIGLHDQVTNYYDPKYFSFNIKW